MKRSNLAKTTALGALALALALPAIAWGQDEPEHAPPATLGTVRVDGRPVGHHGALTTSGKPKAEAAGEEKGEAAEEEESAEPKAINWADFSNKKQPPLAVYLLNFAALIFVLVKLLGGPIMNGLKDRKNRIAKDIEEAARMKKEAEKRAEKYQAQLEGLGADQEATKKALLEAGEADKKRIVREAEEKAARLERDAAQLLEQESRQRKQDLTRETVEAALVAAEELLKKGMTQADQERLAEEFLKELGARPRSVAPAAGGAA